MIINYGNSSVVQRRKKREARGNARAKEKNVCVKK
jgi:hypothetical protein